MTSDLSTLAREAADHLRDGGLVAIPTETQYALAARAADAAAVARCFALKQRPADEPQPIFLPSVSALDDVADGLSGGLRALARVVWPGALTLVLRKRPDWHSAAVPGDTVALRIPDHPIALAVLGAIQEPITGSSANVHGRPAALSAADVRRSFGDDVLILPPGDLVPQGTASTILDCARAEPRLLREGAIPRSRIEALVAEHLATTIT
ncbi:MAG: L-threonylcarbamoyladenylate synthase [Chloroflexi bacterium]|nr:L-threonylcarbamoyladenylate synthase [Chloroflexota bacterium]